ncbi:hypothetical protein LJC17_02625 [Acholeplasma sp. OttesenSCG-928-E16]|nr:hypothetical protein [Acholeplasma sp. OttesenSCG-928-E16]
MKKILLSISMLVFVSLSLFACGKKALVIWVGVESVDYYTEVVADYKALYKAEKNKDFPHAIEVKGVDTGTAAATFLNDTDAGADILTIAHDNLARLTSGSSAIAPITDQTLIDQVKNDNVPEYVAVTKSTVQGTEYSFGVPYIGQALILYYDKSKISDTQAQSWEGILEAAAAAKKQAFSLTGTDGYNNSFLLLAVEESSKTSSIKIYDGGVQDACNATGADVLSFMKYGQEVLFDMNNPYAGRRTTDSGWTVELTQGQSLSVVGGAWHYNAAKAALGTNLGIAKLPTFTLTTDTVYDVDNNQDLVGKTYRSGTFADIKMFVKKKDSKFAEYLDGILKYLSSPEVQEGSFINANNLPSYKNASAEFDSLQLANATTDAQKEAIALANAQLGMFEYGIPQPFGVSSNFNFYFYSKNAPEMMMDLLDNIKGTGSLRNDAAILAEMTKVQNIWKTGNAE